MADEFTFDPTLLAALLSEAEAFAVRVSVVDGPLTDAQWAAWLRGRANAGAELSVTDAITAAHQRVRSALAARGLELVRGGVARQFRDGILQQLLSGEFDGQNPAIVAQQLRKRFGAAEYNWERLATSEIGTAQADGKLALYAENGLEQYNYTTVGDSLVSAICRANAAGGPYRVGDPNGKRPVRDSHPGCRCTVTPVV